MPRQLWLVVLWILGLAASVEGNTRPNVILIMTDDQGYGDIGAHGNDVVNTPHMNQLHAESVRFTQFHVDPSCSPTRAALLTGRYSARVGVWHTVMGRSVVRDDETFMSEVFRNAGYRTAVFGKWHLGETYPYGPQYRGFQETLIHGGGAIGNTQDYWGNDYFDDHYLHNGEWRAFKGYCADVFFNEALRFIEKHRNEPFFVYLTPNTPHWPLHVEDRYVDIYLKKNVPERVARYWAMVSNLDDNIGILRRQLKELGIADNTIIVFMGDNGTTLPDEKWRERYNAGMRGYKTSEYDGGHRAFCFIHDPRIGSSGKDVHRLTAHIDIMPTLLDQCDISVPVKLRLDGRSLTPLLLGQDSDWPDRVIVVHNQRVLDPIKWKQTAVMTDSWRLVNNNELYDLDTDPGQQHNVIDRYPDVAERLRKSYEAWWDDVSQRFGEMSRWHIGAEEEPITLLTAHDWLVSDLSQLPWDQTQILRRRVGNGPWAVRVVRDGRYAFILRERPEAAAYVLTATHARLRIAEEDLTVPIAEGATSVRIELTLSAGDAMLQTWMREDGRTDRGAYYVEVHYLGQ